MDALLQILDEAGFVGPFLVVVAAAMWFSLGQRMWLLRAPRALDLDSLLRAAPGGATVFEQALDAAVAQARRGGGRAAIVSVLVPYRMALERGGALIGSAVAIAPLAGLLGTVTGMIETFDSLQSMELFSRGGGIGAGIGEAMVSTQMGLVVAVPGLLAGAMLQQRQVRLEEALDAVTDRLVRQGAP